MSKPSLMRQRRKAKGWNQSQLAEALGVTKGYVSKIEMNGTNSVKTAQAIQAIFTDLTIEQISNAETE